ncbi:hypothetical protein FQN53_006324 [Emmonsiellopsis sp. PD_33]|nr:hypothetical protein FQN53_006324 [Emmonsiellopsis sp. PD_33]
MHPIFPLDHHDHQQVAPDEQLSLSDQDVEILLQIVDRAEQQPDAHRLPFRALFAAYDAVLSEYGIEKESDRTYLRFLFQLGDKTLRGDSLYAKFEKLLLRFDIRLEYPYDETGSEGGGWRIEQELATADTENYVGVGAEQMRPNGYHRGRPRRASFNSIYDAGNETTRGSIYRPSSRSSVSRLETGTRRLSMSPSRRREAVWNARAPALLQETGGRMTMDRAPKSNHNQLQTDAIPTYSAPPPAGWGGRDLGVNRPLEPKPSRIPRLSISMRSQGESVESIESPSSEEGEPIVKAQLPPELLYQPSLSHLLRDASTFNMYRQRGAMRQILIQWAETAKRNQHFFRDMLKVAINRDTNTLLRQVLDTWRDALRQKRQEAQTERFFKHLEKRAARARDLYLLTKAFTHWAQVASDEVKRTSAARQHILRIKYFNAWREITAVNEMKAQRLAMMKPFKRWKIKFQQLQRDEDNAIAVYEDNLVKSTYWKWFWSFCDRRAPQWREYRLKHKSFLSWLRALRTQRERDQAIDSSNKYSLLQAAFQTWAQRLCTISVAQQQADSKWTAKQADECLSEWRVRTHLGPIAAKVSKAVDLRVLRSTIKSWALQTRMSKSAQKVDRLRILRNTWTAWNDNLRCMALSARIDERVVLQAVYKWALVARLRLMTRIHEQRVKREMLERLTINSRGIYTRLLRHEDEFRAHRGRELLRTKLYEWREKLEMQRRRDHVALVFYAPRVEQESLDIWRNRMRHIEEMEGWATDARYYLLLSSCIKQWRTATATSSKKRRQDAYAAVRRKIKMNLATNALSAWRSKVNIITDLERQAIDMDRTHLFKASTELFDKWGRETSRRSQNIRDSEIYYNRQLAYSYLTLMVGAFAQHQNQEEKATQFLEIHTSAVASAQFRKLSLRIFQMRASMETADALNDRNLRKHYRSIFRHWIDKTRSKRQAGLPQYRPTTTASTPARTPARTPAPSLTPAVSSSFRFPFPPSSLISTTPFNPPPPQSPTPAQSHRQQRDSWPTPAQSHHQQQDSWPTPVPAPSQYDSTLNISELGALPSFATQSPLPTPGYLNSPSKRAARARALALGSTTPATPVRTPFAARLRAQARTEPRVAGVGVGMSGGRRAGRGDARRSSLGAIVRFADEEDVEGEDGGDEGAGEGYEGMDEGESGDDGMESPTEGRSRDR